MVNLLCFLAPDDAARRADEVRRACRRLDIELRLAEPELLSSCARRDPARAQALVAAQLSVALEELGPAIVVSPSAHDRHHAHEAVAAGVRAALQAAGARGATRRWAMWAWWGELAIPTTVAGYDEAGLGRARAALAEHHGELERLDLSGALAARARWQAALGPERVMGFGYRGEPGTTGVSGAPDAPAYADLLTETHLEAGRWRLAEPRVLEAGAALAAPVWGRRDLTAWLDAPSVDRLLAGP